MPILVIIAESAFVNTISKYILKNTLKTQLVIFSILMLIFMSQSFIRFISHASRGKIPAELVTQLMSLAVPTMANFMLPLSLFLAILLTMGNLCSQSEMVVMRSVGYSQNRILGIVLFLALITAGINGVCTTFLAPWCESKSLEIIDSARKDPAMFSLDSGRFLNLMDNVIYIEDMEDGELSGGDRKSGAALGSELPDHLRYSSSGNVMKQIYILSQGNEARNLPPSVTIANEGRLRYDKNFLPWLTLKSGLRYEGPSKDGQFEVLYFDRYTALIPESQKTFEPGKVSAKATGELMKSTATVPEKAELEWRFVQPFSVLVLSIMVVPLSMVNPRKGRFAKVLPAIMFYLSYYLFAFGIKSGMTRGHISLIPGLFALPVIYLLLFAIPFNLADTERFRKLASSFKRRRRDNV